MRNFTNRSIGICCSIALIILIFSSCGSDAEQGFPSSTGQGGSMARFTISGNFLYTVGASSMQMFDISDVSNPVKGEYVPIGFNIETIFSNQSTLFIGSQTGMHIFDINDPGQPKLLSVYDHITSCDPVVADGDFAYVTLRSGVDCRFGQNLLDIIDVSDLSNPKLISSQPMINPHGLAIADTVLFVCEGESGLKIFNVKDPLDVKLINHLQGFNAYDIIHRNNTAIITGLEGVFQYDITDLQNLELLSHIFIQRK